MKVLVYDVAAQEGGAATVLESFYHSLTTETDHDYYFVLSLLEFPETDHAHMVRLPWVKKSWFHRLYCDYIYMPRLIKKLGIDQVLSLQNMGIPGCKIPQTVYVHNAIPFTEHRFSFRTERFLWVYQNIIGKMTCRSLKKATGIIVQTQWMKDAVSEKCGVDPERIEVRRVENSMMGQGTYQSADPVTFFYPASAATFKNHRAILDACKLLRDKGICDYKVQFTLTEQEGGAAAELARQARENNLPIEFIGMQNREQMAQRYSESILLFPSYLETVGLPLLEAKQYGAPIIASDCAYAHETVGEYENVSYFSAMRGEELAAQMERWII